jgi:hypothetical protein
LIGLTRNMARLCHVAISFTVRPYHSVSLASQIH